MLSKCHSTLTPFYVHPQRQNTDENITAYSQP
ncbi:hypothetical protein HNQ65_004285 [Prosthecobacter vanneervenii]|uniref:Uncharacterized protein n=1 Tax=Prosthecobacter vanneervenii TaxID=48466 RepID=A0A7W7YER5_9BACT|nr:hypothetical protein [Prosthecobacter vanneervenii]